MSEENCPMCNDKLIGIHWLDGYTEGTCRVCHCGICPNGDLSSETFHMLTNRYIECEHDNVVDGECQDCGLFDEPKFSQVWHYQGRDYMGRLELQKRSAHFNFDDQESVDDFIKLIDSMLEKYDGEYRVTSSVDGGTGYLNWFKIPGRTHSFDKLMREG